MGETEQQATPEQGQQELLKQLQAALAARQQRPAETSEATFNPEEQRQFARFGLDPQRLRFLSTLANFRKGMNLEKGLMDRALQGSAPPGVEGGAEELAPFA